MNYVSHSAEHEAEQLVAQFLAEFRTTGIYLRAPIARLAELATATDSALAESASAVLFASLVERLADSFSPTDVALYNRVFAQLITHCRALGRGRALDRALIDFNLHGEAAILARAEALQSGRRGEGAKGRRAADSLFALSPFRLFAPKVAVVLSRVTLGADVAITSRIIERLKREFPDAEIVLVGGRKVTELFGGDARLTFKEIAYRRAGTTLERLLSWIDVLDGVRELTHGRQPAECLIVDPDSRLTQLGLLPLARQDDGYLFFPSRVYGGASDAALGQLTARWLDEVFGEPLDRPPRLSLVQADTEAASQLVKQLKSSSARPVIALNFGVGENPMKRIGDPFEPALVARLIQQGATIILDKGAGQDETRRADAIIHCLTQDLSARVIEIDEANLPALLQSPPRAADMIVWSGRIGMLAALIAASDLYIGYDSAGQHIAAALGTACIDVFAGYSSPRMLARWRPAGQAETRIIAVDTLGGADTSRVLDDVLQYARELLNWGPEYLPGRIEHPSIPPV
jgi:ADP-heptose:LPS heptosyltransferase